MNERQSEVALILLCLVLGLATSTTGLVVGRSGIVLGILVGIFLAAIVVSLAPS